GATLHDRVLAALESVSNSDLKKIAVRFPSILPAGKGSGLPRDVFRKGDTRALLAGATSEEMRGAALWILGKHDPELALPIAIEALDAKGTSEPVRNAALRVLGHAKGAAFADAFDRIERAFLAVEGILHLAAAQEALLGFRHPDVAARIAKLLPKVANK